MLEEFSSRLSKQTKEYQDALWSPNRDYDALYDLKFSVRDTINEIEEMTESFRWDEYNPVLTKELSLDFEELIRNGEKLEENLDDMIEYREYHFFKDLSKREFEEGLSEVDKFLNNHYTKESLEERFTNEYTKDPWVVAAYFDVVKLLNEVKEIDTQSFELQHTNFIGPEKAVFDLTIRDNCEKSFGLSEEASKIIERVENEDIRHSGESKLLEDFPVLKAHLDNQRETTKFLNSQVNKTLELHRDKGTINKDLIDR